MINPELQKYVSTSLEGGHDAANVRHALLSAGWDPKDVDEALATASTPVVAVPPAATTNAPGATAVAEPEKKHELPIKKILVAGAAVLVILVLGGGAFAAYKSGLLPGAGMADAELLAGLPANLQAIESATYEGSLTFESVPRDAGARPFNIDEYYLDTESDLDQELPEFASYLEGVSESYAYLPSEILVRVTAGGSTANTDETNTDGKFHASADIMLADFSLSAGAELLKKGENAYFRINKSPSLFFDLSALKDKWVAITPQDSGSAAGFMDPEYIQKFLSEKRGENSNGLEQLRLFYGMAHEEGAIATVGNPTSERLNGQNTRLFRLALAHEKLPALYARAARELEEKYGTNAIVKFDQKTADYLVSPEWNKLAEYLAENTTFEVWLDAKTGQLAKFSASIRVIPPDEVQKLKNIQYVLRFDLALTDVNRPVVIDAPMDAMSWDDAVILLSGKSREEVFAERQARNISDIRRALDTYHEYASAYPNTLDELIVSYEDLYAKFPTDDTFAEMRAESFGSSKLLDKVPSDAYTKETYNYSRASDDYVIEYNVNLPQGSTDSFLLGQVVNGVNHATSEFMSRENGSTGDFSF
jgi:hypothetical protein